MKATGRSNSGWVWLILPLVMTGCGGGGGGSSSSGQPSKDADVVATSYMSASGTEGTLRLKNASGGTLDYLVVDDGLQKQIKQAILTDAAGQRTRTYFTADGDIDRIEDESSGDFLKFTWYSDSLLITAHAANGAYRSGSVFKYDDSGKLVMAPVMGTPSFSGQLSGQLQSPSLGSGKFMLTAKSLVPDGSLVVGAFSPLPDSLQTVLVQSGSAPLAKAPATLVSSLQVVGVDDSEDVVLWANDALKKQAVQVAQRNRGKLVLGAVLGSACAGLVVGCQATGIAVAGISLSMLIGGYVAEQGGYKVMNEVNQEMGLPPIDDQQDSAFDRVRSSVAESWRKGEDLVSAFREDVQQLRDEGVNKLKQLGDLVTEHPLPGFGPSPVSGKDITTAPVPQSAPPVDTPVSGMAVSSNGSTYTLDGQVRTDGNLTVGGQDSAGVKKFDLAGSKVDGAVSGTVTDGDGGLGVFDGTQAEIGQCVTQQLGGTFPFYEIISIPGNGSTIVNISYQVSQPLNLWVGFAISTNGGSTRILSGSGIVSLTVTTPSLFAAVPIPATGSNPQDWSGAQWSLTLSCQ